MAIKNYGQVYLATHDGEGNSLSNAQRSFISFSWGGKNIEDFSLLATIDGDRKTGNLYSEFEDLTTEYDIIDGQIFWGSKYNPNTLSFTLSTDGIKEPMLQAFKNWFRAGITRELILAESPNRAIQARVSTAPTYSLLPFESQEKVKIGDIIYTTKTTIWKGDISLSFIMEDPFWYSVEEMYTEDITNTKEDVLKTILEDGIPHKNMLKTSCFLANGVYYFIDEQQSSSTESSVDLTANEPVYVYYCGTGKEKPTLSFTINSTFDENSNYIILPYNNYSNTENSYNTITLSSSKIAIPENFIEEIDNGNDYGQFLERGEEESSGNEDDSINDENLSDSTTESSDPILDEQSSNEESDNSVNTKKIVSEFKFTTPGIFTSYNQAVKILTTDFSAGDSIIELRKAFRDSISDYYVRSYAMGICDLALDGKLNLCDSASALNSDFSNNFIAYLKQMFTGVSGSTPIRSSYSFNSKTGESEITINVYMLDYTPSNDTASITEEDDSENENLQENNTSLPLINDPILVKENVGDMARSSYLIIDTRTLPTNGEINSNDRLELMADCDLSDVKLNYHYMYL